MKARWLAGAVFAGGAALAASWGLGLWDAPAAIREEAAPAGPSGAGPAAAAPFEAVAVALAGARLNRPRATQRQASDVSGCGARAEPCAEDAVCIDGGCFPMTCAVDAGSSASCALSGGQVGTCCGLRCVDVEVDAAHCGRCGDRCRQGLDCVSGECLAGNCTAQMAGTPCSQSGQGRGTCCRGACVEPTTWADDPANCGACGHACAPGLTCKEGACTDPATGAPPAWTCMSAEHGCPAGTFCAVDACLPKSCSPDGDGLLCPSPALGVPGHCCTGRCIDLFTDRENCGACGVRCSQGETCESGECASTGP